MNDCEGEVQAAGYAGLRERRPGARAARALVPALSIDAPASAATSTRAASRSPSSPTALVRAEGLSFRQAHEIAAAVRKAVIAPGRASARRLSTPSARHSRRCAGRPTDDGAEAFRAMTSPEHFVAVRDRFGGPAPAALDAASPAIARRSSPGAALDRAPRTRGGCAAAAATRPSTASLAG